VEVEILALPSLVAARTTTAIVRPTMVVVAIASSVRRYR
jgi:hypothetical protein